MSEFSMPSEWVLSKLEELVSQSFTGLVRSASEQGIENSYSYLKMNNISTSGKFDLSDLVKVNADKFEAEKYSLKKGDFIFNTRNSVELVGKCGVFKIDSPTPILFNNNLLKINFFHVKPEVVAHWLNSAIGKDQLKSITSATTSVAAIYQKQLMAIDVPVIPLAEQQQIAQKLDELLAQVDTLKTRLDAIPKILKRFRQSVLAAAVSGRLTEEWRENHKLEVINEDIYCSKKLNKIDDDEKYLDSPNGWGWVRFGSVVLLINGDRGKNYPNQSEYVEQGLPFINTGHIDPNGTLSVQRMNYITRDKFNSLGSGKIKSGDLVYCLRGATMGKTAFVDPFEEGAIASSLVIVRPSGYILKEYAYYFLISPTGKDLILKFDNGSAQPNLSAGSLAIYPLALPSITEQTEIVRRVEQLFAYADQIEQRVKDAQARVNHLTQSILAKAFRGELTAQWRAQNPALISGENSAAALLERIKAVAKPRRKAKS